VHNNSRLFFERYARPCIKPGDRVLEIGPDDLPSAYQRSIEVEVGAWDTLDFPVRPGLTHTLSEPYQFPLPDNSYDVVLSGQVIVHVPKIWRWMPELARVVRPGGTVVTLAPVSWPFCQAPKDYWRIYPEGLRALYQDAGLEVTVAEWGSLELEPFVARLPARLRNRSLWQRLSGSILLLHEHAHLRVQGAFDTIVIGIKPLSPEQISEG
jgi:SAM-dependent methyltransferase